MRRMRAFQAVGGEKMKALTQFILFMAGLYTASLHEIGALSFVKALCIMLIIGLFICGTIDIKKGRGEIESNQN